MAGLSHSLEQYKTATTFKQSEVSPFSSLHLAEEDREQTTSATASK